MCIFFLLLLIKKTAGTNIAPTGCVCVTTQPVGAIFVPAVFFIESNNVCLCVCVCVCSVAPTVSSIRLPVIRLLVHVVVSLVWYFYFAKN